MRCRGGRRFTELQSYCPYLDDLGKGVGPFPGEATSGQIDGADGCLVLNALTKHYKGKKKISDQEQNVLIYCVVNMF